MAPCPLCSNCSALTRCAPVCTPRSATSAIRLRTSRQRFSCWMKWTPSLRPIPSCTPSAQTLACSWASTAARPRTLRRQRWSSMRRETRSDASSRQPMPPLRIMELAMWSELWRRCDMCSRRSARSQRITRTTSHCCRSCRDVTPSCTSHTQPTCTPRRTGLWIRPGSGSQGVCVSIRTWWMGSSDMKRIGSCRSVMRSEPRQQAKRACPPVQGGTSGHCVRWTTFELG
mmetsp:Transcript_64478/g.144050  ORF Transcript_64478/g.144050 Transcript_64478/m.144050 type:complete len:229 (+) Transcript_64478:193-879(+)